MLRSLCHGTCALGAYISVLGWEGAGAAGAMSFTGEVCVTYDACHPTGQIMV